MNTGPRHCFANLAMFLLSFSIELAILLFVKHFAGTTMIIGLAFIVTASRFPRTARLEMIQKAFAKKGAGLEEEGLR